MNLCIHWAVLYISQRYGMGRRETQGRYSSWHQSQPEQIWMELIKGFVVQSVQFTCSVVSSSLRPHGLQHTRHSCPSPTPNLLKLKSIESVMPPNHINLCLPLLLLHSIFPSIRVFSNESVLQFFTLGGQSIGVSASVSVLPMNIQDWFPLRWTSWISFQSKGLSRVPFKTTVQFFSVQLSL